MRCRNPSRSVEKALAEMSVEWLVGVGEGVGGEGAKADWWGAAGCRFLTLDLTFSNQRRAIFTEKRARWPCCAI